jgi:hypothetical protein
MYYLIFGVYKLYISLRFRFTGRHACPGVFCCWYDSRLSSSSPLSKLEFPDVGKRSESSSALWSVYMATLASALARGE